MKDRVIIETNSESEAIALMSSIEKLGYKPGPIVKVCVAGRCGGARLFVKK